MMITSIVLSLLVMIFWETGKMFLVDEKPQILKYLHGRVEDSEKMEKDDTVRMDIVYVYIELREELNHIAYLFPLLIPVYPSFPKPSLLYHL